jgi:hypothetical protein
VSPLSDWLQWKAKSTYTKFNLIEVDESKRLSEDVKQYLSSLLQSARIDLDLLKAASKRLGWKGVQELLVAGRQPTLPPFKRGDFGEVLTCALLVEFHNCIVPIQKLRYTITPNQRLPGTDAIAVRRERGKISEVYYVESKLRTTPDTQAAVEAWNQLVDDYGKKLPDMIYFALARLFEMQNPLYYDFLDYASDRKTATRIDRFCIGLVWDRDKWSTSVLDNLNKSVDPKLPKLLVPRVHVSGLIRKTNAIFKAIGMDVEDDE